MSQALPLGPAAIIIESPQASNQRVGLVRVPSKSIGVRGLIANDAFVALDACGTLDIDGARGVGARYNFCVAHPHRQILREAPWSVVAAPPALKLSECARTSRQSWAEYLPFGDFGGIGWWEGDIDSYA
jgi:hypothetical protein